MTNRTILDAVHEPGEGLHKAGAMDATTMREFNALCAYSTETCHPFHVKAATQTGAKLPPIGA